MKDKKWYDEPMVLSAVQCNYGEDSHDIMKNHVIANDFNGEQLLHLNAEGHVSNYNEERDGAELDAYLAKAGKNGLREILYWNVHCVYENTIEKHPEWKQKTKDGDDIIVYGNQYLICINTPWMDEYKKNLKKLFSHKLDGLFLDGPVFMRNGCYCKYCRQKFKQRYNKEITRAELHEFLEFRTDSVTEMIKTTYELKQEIRPETRLYINNSALRADVTGSNTSKVYPYVDFLGTEGGFCWINKEFDYTHTTTHAKYIETKANGKPYVVFIAGDAKPWSYVMHTGPETARLYALSLAQGANIWYGIHGPTKMMKSPAGRKAAQMNRYIKDNKQYLTGTKSQAKIALMWSDATSNYYASSIIKTDFTDEGRMGTGDKHGDHLESLKGFADMLTRSHMQYDIADQDCITDGRINGYDLLIFPTYACMSDEEAEAIKEYVKGGGNIICTYDTALYDELGVRRGTGALDDVLGIKRGGLVGYGDVGVGYARIYEEIEEDLMPVCGHAWEIEARDDAKIMIKAYYPMEGRYVAFPTEGFGYASKSKYGEGTGVYVSGTMGEDYSKWCHPQSRKFIERRVLETADPLTRTNAPQSVEVSLRKQKETGRVMIHLVNMTRGPGRPMEETIPVSGITVGVSSLKAKKAFGIYTRTEYNVIETEDGCEVEIPGLGEYEVIVLEQEGL